MRNNIERLHGSAPTPEEVAAEIRRAEELRSEFVHQCLTSACSGLGRIFQRLHLAISVRPAAISRRGVASPSDQRNPTRVTKEEGLISMANRGVRRQWLGWLCAASVVVLFSSFTLVSRFGTLEALRPVDLAALRFGVGGLLLLPIFLYRGLSGLSMVQALSLAALGGLGFALLAYTGFSLSPAAHGAVFLHGMLPVFGTICGLLILSEKPTRRRVLGAGLTFIGALVLGGQGANDLGVISIGGDLCLIGAGVCWSAYGALAQRYGVSAIVAASIVTPLAMLAYLPVYVVALEPKLAQIAVSSLVIQAVFQGVFIGIVSLVVYTQAVALLGATRTALATAAVPSLTTLGGIPLLGEVPSLQGWLGVGVTTVGMIVVFLSGNQSPHGRSEQ